jgi:hypothetical protein
LMSGCWIYASKQRLFARDVVSQKSTLWTR